MTEERKETFEEEINQSERIDADEEPLSRMSRKASRQSKQKQKQKQKPRQERGESTVKDKLAFSSSHPSSQIPLQYGRADSFSRIVQLP